MMERRQALGGSLPRRTDAAPRSRSSCPATSRSPSCAAVPATRPCRRRWASPGCCATSPATSTSAPRRADHPRRGPHVRHGRAVPRAQDLRRAGPEVRAGRPRPAALLHRVERRPDPRGGHHRSRLDGQLHRRRHGLRHPRRADGAVLHLLFDVRFPARRRPHLAGRRRPGPGLPARRHRRAHHAARRGAAAPGRPQPRAGLHACPPCRPTTRRSPTRWRRSCRPGCTGCTAPTHRPSSATSSTTSRCTTRTT